jgi:hypothetical protein
MLVQLFPPSLEIKTLLPLLKTAIQTATSAELAGFTAMSVMLTPDKPDPDRFVMSNHVGIALVALMLTKILAATAAYSTEGSSTPIFIILFLPSPGMLV